MAKKEDPVIAAAVGVATASRKRGSTIEAAMAQAVLDIQAASEAIWADPAISLEEKNEKIAVLNHPDAVRATMMKYRADAKAAMQPKPADEEKADEPTK